METFDSIRNANRLIYEYIRGSHAYGLNTPSSDVDTGGIYLPSKDDIIGLGFNLSEEVSDASHDTTWYSLKKFMSLLAKSNPTVLESLFIPDRCVKYESPIITEIKRHKDKFLTKECFKAFVGYADSQIKKSKGYNKMCNWEEVKRKTPMDFCYTFYKQGTSHIKNWLEARGLKQEYCGLCNCNHTRDAYAVFYDFGQHFEKEGITKDSLVDTEKLFEFVSMLAHQQGYYFTLEEWFDDNAKPKGYRGISYDDSNDVHCSSIEKYEEPICHLIYNRDEYSHHCVKYREYTEWLTKRNQVRYLENKGKQYDRKNAMHTIRLMNMGIEIAQGKGFNVDRTDIDAKELLQIRNGDLSYEDFISMAIEKKETLDKLITTSTLPEKVDMNYINDMYKNIVSEYVLNV